MWGLKKYRTSFYASNLKSALSNISFMCIHDKLQRINLSSCCDLCIALAMQPIYIPICFHE